MSGWGNSRLQKFYQDIQVTYDKEFVALMSIIARVPFLWFDEQNILLDKWETYHLYFLKDAPMDVERFKELLMNIKPKEQKVMGLIVKVNTQITLYLRLEYKSGGFIVDLINQNARASDLYCLQEILSEFQIKTFEANTVILDQKNFVFISKNISSKPENIPAECIVRRI